jgi:leucyl-tRNA synthetase
MPVDLYVGGAEHAVLHLLYARFWHKVLYDCGLVTTREPFQRLFNQGMIHAMSYNDSPDGRGKFYYPEEVHEVDDSWLVKESGQPVFTKVMKMSKSRYNVTNPDDMCRVHGADAMRLYEMFMGPLEDGAMWENSGVAGTRRFLERTWRMIVDNPKITDEAVDNPDVERALHRAIKKVTEAIESLRFNTAVSEMMIFVNLASRAKRIERSWLDMFLRILAPFAPHVAEELWQQLGHEESLRHATWPDWDEEKLKVAMVTLAVQVNGKLRSTLDVPVDIPKEEALAAARADERVARFMESGTLRREIYVPKRLINFVVK